MKVIDFRARPITKEWQEFLSMPFQKRHVASALARRGLKEFPTQTVDDLIREMDEAGVSVGVVLGRDLETSLGWKWENEKVADIVSKYPQRLIGFAGIDPHKGMAAVREVDKAVKLGFKGVSLDPFLQKIRMNDKKAYPVYAKCAEHGLIVSITTGMSPWGESWGYMDWCNTLDVDEVATDFPEIDIVLVHAGFPWVWETLATCARHSNVYIETSGIANYLGGAAAGPYVQAANDGLSERFVFGSAAPYTQIKPAMDFLKQLPFKPEVLEKVFYSNAARILKV